MIRAGELNKRIKIQFNTSASQDAHGNPVANWTTIDNGDLWASIKPISGSESYLATKVVANATHEIRIRKRPGITTQHRATFKNRVFDINAVMNVDEANEQLLLICAETPVAIAEAS